MRTKAIKDLKQLPKKKFFLTVSEGLNHILNNAKRISQDAEKLVNDKPTLGHEILRAIAEEEVAKFFILLDAVRCNRKLQKLFSEQIGKFDKHLAKGIYAEAYTLNFATFSELREYIEEQQKKFYLDGFEGIEYIFGNSILRNREQKMYVDYVETDDGHTWLVPEEPFSKWVIPFENLHLAQAFFDAGCTSPESLELIANKWSAVQIQDNTHIQEIRNLNQETLKELNERQLLNKQPDEVYAKIIKKWLFPLHTMDLKMNDVDIKDLRKIQENWSPW